MGLYFIAAGNSSKNREKSLDKCFTIEQLSPYIGTNIIDKLKTCFRNDNRIYLWGANPGRSLSQLEKAEPGCFAVDVKNTKVIQVFEYCFYIKTDGTNLQEYIKWDEEKPSNKRRPYEFVFFLRNPRKNRNDKIDKSYFQKAFSQHENQNWLVGQRYFNDAEVNAAMKVTGYSNIEDFLGFSNSATPRGNLVYKPQSSVSRPAIDTPPNEPYLRQDEIPEWISSVVENVAKLKKDGDHRERAHEALVEELFVALGYTSITDIKYQQGRIDIKICQDEQTLIVIEVKRNWALTRNNRDYLEQAFKYAQRPEISARYVIITNGDRYCIYDQDLRGRSYEEKFMGEVSLLQLTKTGLQLLDKMKKGCLPA